MPDESLTLWQLNVRGWKTKAAEVAARVQLAEEKPDLILLNETFLDKSTADNQVKLEGYTLVARRDRTDDSGWGGVAVFAKESLANRVVLVHTAEEEERLWLVLHADRGPYLVGAWYRAPDPGNTQGVDSLREELENLQEEYLGTVLVGDLNVHSKRWLKFSTGETPEGTALQELCADFGFFCLRGIHKVATRFCQSLSKGCLQRGTLGEKVSAQSSSPSSARFLRSSCSSRWKSFTSVFLTTAAGSKL